MKLSPPASSSDLDAAREVARRLNHIATPAEPARPAAALRALARRRGKAARCHRGRPFAAGLGTGGGSRPPRAGPPQRPLPPPRVAPTAPGRRTGPRLSHHLKRPSPPSRRANAGAPARHSRKSAPPPGRGPARGHARGGRSPGSSPAEVGGRSVAPAHPSAGRGGPAAGPRGRGGGRRRDRGRDRNRRARGQHRGRGGEPPHVAGDRRPLPVARRSQGRTPHQPGWPRGRGLRRLALAWRREPSRLGWFPRWTRR